MQRAVLLLCWLPLLNHCHAVNPGCSCVVYSSSDRPQGGTFTSPYYPKPYPSNIDCLLYTFIGQPDEIVKLTFHHFNIRRARSDCVGGDFLKVFLHLEGSGVSEYTPWSGVLCGDLRDVPQVLYSSRSTLILEFHTQESSSSNATGFFGNFHFIDRRLFETDGVLIPGTMCDLEFVSSQSKRQYGRFYSPRYPSSYPKNIRCSYLFRARLKERIRLFFEEISLQKGDLSCLNRADLIRVHDGTDSGAATIAMLCNQGAEVEVLSTGSDLYVEFVANSEWPGQGFKAMFQFQPFDDAPHPEPDKVVPGAVTGNPKYSVIGPAVSATTSLCDMVFNSDTTKTGVVTSPGYPNPYPPRTHCTYEFQGRGKERVQLVFHDLNLYHTSNTANECEGVDSLMAYVHIDRKKEKIDSFCGEKPARPIMSNGPRLSLEFNGITSSRQSPGFKAVYTFTENFGITTGRQEAQYPCAFVYNSNETRNGTFTSPNYPGLYPRDTECHYFFNGQPNERIHLHFHFFDVEGVMPCEPVSASDFVEFSNFMSRDRKYSRHCGQQKEFDVNSDRKFFRVTFKSNDRYDGTGFNASYVFVDDEGNYTTKPPTSNASTLKGATMMMLLLLLVFTDPLLLRSGRVSPRFNHDQ
ncbi:suppressor of lurcher protein 1 isoform X2 [Apis mellifera]|nr:suppressor of lurcher protein 1 isoform X2 [Apis mellifera]XP_016772057.1 suppressor of lurcher protein 1 isoform X2 [Apis mellifera]|eukprot:XP_006563716.1 suppressor of lurcher protein 1 isoform X2 [Apis mellifera]